MSNLKKVTVSYTVERKGSKFPVRETEQRVIDLSQIPEAGLRRESCGGCGVSPRQTHEEGCDWAHCPDCGEQLLLHDCPNWPDDAEGPDRASIWHGIRPDEEAAVKAGFFYFHPAPDINRYVPDDGLARVRLKWDPKGQKFRVK